jgi:uncharacterized protein YjbI with pentapeptide repeats
LLGKAAIALALLAVPAAAWEEVRGQDARGQTGASGRMLMAQAPGAAQLGVRRNEPIAADSKPSMAQGQIEAVPALDKPADLAGHDLRHADFREAMLVGADLSDAQLQGADLSGAQLQGADLSGAQLQGADLSLARLEGANLHGAQLQGASLPWAQLQGADFSHAQLQGTNLYEAQLWRITTNELTNLSLANLSGARADRLDEVTMAELGAMANSGRAKSAGGNAMRRRVSAALQAILEVPDTPWQPQPLPVAQRQDVLLDQATDEAIRTLAGLEPGKPVLGIEDYAAKLAAFLGGLACGDGWTARGIATRIQLEGDVLAPTARRLLDDPACEGAKTLSDDDRNALERLFP